MAEVGRPTVMTEETLRKLEEAFLIGATDKEACLVAGISEPALYAYCNNNPGYKERKEALKDSPKYKARKNIVEAINAKDIDTSKWYAERKGKNEFSTRTDLSLSDNATTLEGITQEEIDIAKQILEQRRSQTISPKSEGIISEPMGREISNKE